jgi:hypothetical protein
MGGSTFLMGVFNSSVLILFILVLISMTIFGTQGDILYIYEIDT